MQGESPVPKRRTLQKKKKKPLQMQTKHNMVETHKKKDKNKRRQTIHTPNGQAVSISQ